MPQEDTPETKSQEPRLMTEGQALVAATRSHFAAQRDSAAAELMIYLNRSSGVADHPNIVDNVNSLVIKLAEANECLKVIETTFSSTK